MPVLLQPDEAAKKAIGKAHKSLKNAACKMTDSLVDSLEGSGLCASGTIIVEIKVYDLARKKIRPVGDADAVLQFSAFMEPAGTVRS